MKDILKRLKKLSILIKDGQSDVEELRSHIFSLVASITDDEDLINEVQTAADPHAVLMKVLNETAKLDWCDWNMDSELENSLTDEE